MTISPEEIARMRELEAKAKGNRASGKWTGTYAREGVRSAVPENGREAMTACEKCWMDAAGDAEEYGRLIKERTDQGNTCTPEQQAGSDATTCAICKRATLHQHTHECMNPVCTVGQ